MSRKLYCCAVCNGVYDEPAELVNVETEEVVRTFGIDFKGRHFDLCPRHLRMAILSNFITNDDFALYPKPLELKEEDSQCTDS